MNFSNAKNLIYRNMVNLKGYHTNRKIIVFESDDWGSIRMPSKNILESIPDHYKKYYNSPYYQYDTIADNSDLQNLFELLYQYTDKNGRSAVFTANTVVANPDFNKIISSNYEQYYYETIDKTISRYYDKHTFEVWFEGINCGVFIPQLHAREHVDIVEWLEILKSGNKVYLDAIRRGIYCVDYDLNAKKKNLTAAFDFSDINEIKEKCTILKDAVKIFNNLFGFKSKSFIAPSYTWNDTIENALYNKGIKYLQGIRVQKIPIKKRYEYRAKFHYTGEKNKNEQYYLVRNVFFEPTLMKTSSVVEDTLRRIKLAFLLKQPVIIGSHRLNFIGAIDKKNRDNNLLMLDNLLSIITKTWPDIEFMTTPELGLLISKQR